ncbi:MAG TPA: DNA polymerase/3'-5' exonuclease PolX [Gammaproteobacteria bacterium]|nr:DNA polymerase/3'-5' exonuclease PolX [Gammaproteobacteria bacterium]
MAVHNDNIAAIFEEMADLLEIDEANPFRVRAYRNAARTIRGLSREVSDLVREDKDLTELPGIGKDLAAKIREILDSGHAAALDKLHKEIPASVEDLLKLPGLGPKRVKQLYHEQGIENLVQLESAARKQQLRNLPGFGSKTEQNILDNIHALRSKERRFLRNVAVSYAEPLIKYLKTHKEVRKAIIAGSYRRGRESVGDLDILVTAGKPRPVMEHFARYEEVGQTVSRGDTRATVILHCGLQVDLRVVAEKDFGSALYYFTGSKAHNIRVRRLAQQQGLKINEYGVYRNNKRVAGKTEESVFKSVGLPFIPPELREDRGEIKAALNQQLPQLVEAGDIRGDLHTHTVATDGRATIKEMALAARKSGLDYLAITDHSRHLAVTHGLEPEQLVKQMDEIDELNANIKGMTVLKGIEVDILEDGTLDIPDRILSRLDLVVAAVHSQFQLSRKKQTGRILRAMDNRYFSMLAHPSGRLLFDREPCNLDMEKIIRKAADRGCFMELNSQPKRLDLTDIYCQLACNEGVLVCINSDAHDIDGFHNLSYGVKQARRGWLEKKNVLNTRPLKTLRRLLQGTM